ncbi:glycoside hydrolase family 2 protein [Micromonospora sp. NPDC000089]|uniref:glycoside hydrolase family 2 protein n=1 Tax=unclassified Micromonospora TaxID=2617518 RepID=UPI0036A7419C
MQHLVPSGPWNLRLAAPPTATEAPAPPDAVATATVPAQVPGCVHTDLLAAGLIPDPYVEDNERELTWIGHCAWEYTTSLDPGEPLGADERLDLVFDGLDTFATVSLGGVRLGETRNMHRSYRFDVADALRDGPRELSVHFAATRDETLRASQENGPRTHCNAHPYNAVRRMACGYGWDWGPDLVTAGIWRGVRLERWRTARLATVRPAATVEAGNGVVRLHVDLERATAVALTLTATVGGVRAQASVDAGADTAELELVVPDPALWWPRGYGDAPLHELTVELTDGDAAVLDTWSRRIGFRTVELDTAPDEAGIPFHLKVNGKLVLVRGVNWIPDDAFPSRVDRSRYADRLAQAADAGVNLLRVWGGGTYESADFYELCDERGLLVQQDFLFACAAYAEEEPLRGEVVAEAREAVTRLAPYPSLVLWCGGNETIVGFAEWHGWRQRLAGQTWGEGYYLDVLPGIVAELDPTRPYAPNSPYSFGPFASPNEQALGTVHIWDVWNNRDYTHYADWKPRFVAEFGFQGPPTWSTLTAAVHDEPLTPDGPQMLVHQKAEEGNDKLARGLAPHLPAPTDIRDWHWATQLNQARAIRFGIEHFRSLAPYCTGTILWQLNDCWPVVSWAVVDGYGRRKPAWYALRAAYADRVLTFQPRDGGLALVAVNDTDEVWQGSVLVEARTAAGEVRAREKVDLDAAARHATVVELPTALSGGADLLTATADGPSRAFWYAAEDVAAGLPPARTSTRVERTDTGYRVHVRAESLVKDLALLVDLLDPAAVADTMLETLLPGESTVVEVRTPELADPEALTRHPVLRTANDLFR